MNRIFGFFIIFFIFLIAPSFTFAESCNCFCKSSDGVEDHGSVEDIPACQEYCDTFLGCYTEDQKAMYPELNTLCWEEHECINDVETGELVGEWDGQSNFCIKGEGLCYSEPEPVKLNVMIGSLTEAKGLGEYINAIYSFSLGAGSLLAIVMIMIGGLQYMLARGNDESIASAKKRISNAVTGIILLFASYAIANLMNPQFVTFNRLSPPRIRAVVFLDEDSTCEAMERAGLDVSSTLGKSCGVIGEVTSVGDVQTSVTLGAKCAWTKCGEMETCMSSAQAESGYQCIRCGLAVDKGVSPSASTCQKLTPIDPDPSDDEFFYCLYDPGVIDLWSTACVEIAYPITWFTDRGTGLDCDKLRRDARASGYEGCRAYDNVQASYISWFDLSNIGIGETDIEWDEADDIERGDGNFPFLAEICTSDPCNLAPPGEACVVFSLDLNTEVGVGMAALTVRATPLLVSPVGPAVIIGLAELGAVAGFLGDEVFANCSNTSSWSGFVNNLDHEGNPISELTIF